MSIQRNRPGTVDGTRATVSLDLQSTTVDAQEKKDLGLLPPVNQIISDEVDLFFETWDQTRLTAADVELYLFNRINNRLDSENSTNGLKGARAYRTIQTLPLSVIAECIVRRDLPHTGLLGESAATAALVTYCGEGPDQGLYVPTERLVRSLAREYHYTISPNELNAVVELIKDTVPLLTPTEDGDIVALANSA